MVTHSQCQNDNAKLLMLTRYNVYCFYCLSLAKWACRFAYLTGWNSCLSQSQWSQLANRYRYQSQLREEQKHLFHQKRASIAILLSNKYTLHFWYNCSSSIYADLFSLVVMSKRWPLLPVDPHPQQLWFSKHTAWSLTRWICKMRPSRDLANPAALQGNIKL